MRRAWLTLAPGPAALRSRSLSLGTAAERVASLGCSEARLGAGRVGSPSCTSGNGLGRVCLSVGLGRAMFSCTEMGSSWSPEPESFLSPPWAA